MTKSALSAIVLRNLILLTAQALLQACAVGLLKRLGIKGLCSRRFTRQRLIGFIEIDMAIAVGIFH